MYLYLYTCRSRDSVVGIATSNGLGDRGGRSSNPGRVKNFLFSKSSRPALRSTQPPIQWVPGALSPGVKRPGREIDQSPPTSAEVNKMWLCTSTPPYAFMKHRDKFTFTLLASYPLNLEKLAFYCSLICFAFCSVAFTTKILYTFNVSYRSHEVFFPPKFKHFPWRSIYVSSRSGL
jgi:hypothetical protein